MEGRKYFLSRKRVLKFMVTFWRFGESQSLVEETASLVNEERHVKKNVIYDITKQGLS